MIAVFLSLLGYAIFYHYDLSTQGLWELPKSSHNPSIAIGFVGWLFWV